MTARQALWVILVAGGVLRVVPIWFGLPYLQARPDEETAIGHALAILDGDPNPHFFHWPSLTFYLLAALFAAASWLHAHLSPGGALGAEHYVLLARGVVAVAGTLTLFVVYRIGRRMGDVGLLAALFLAVAILHVRESHFAMTDVLMTLLLMSSLALLLRGLDAGQEMLAGRLYHVRWFALAGLAGGLATSTKYSAAAILAAMAAAQLVLFARHRLSTSQSWSSAGLPSVAFVVAFAAAFLAGTPYALLDWPAFAADFAFDVRHLADGHGVDLGRGWTYHLRQTLPYGAGIPTCLAALAGLVPLARHHRGTALVAGALAAALYVSIGSGRTVFFRYALPLIPLVALAAAAGVRHAGAWVAPRLGVPARTGVVLVAALVAAPSAVSSVWFDALLARTDTRVIAARWLIAHSDPSQSLYEAPDLYARLDLGSAVHQWRFDAASGTFVDAGGRVPDWLVLHESPLWTYARIPPALRRLAAARYELVFRVRGTKGAARSAVYDLQDAFFVPISGFHAVERPGPTVLVYRRAP